MPVKIASVGLGKIGASAAKAIAQCDLQIQITGWDPDLDVRVAADRLKVFNPVCKKLKDAARDTELFLVCLPTDDFVPALRELKAVSRQGLILVNLSSVHAQTYGWVKEILGKHAHFISIFPSVSAEYLSDNSFGTEAAQANLFKDSRIFIADAGEAEEAVLDLAVDIAVLLGGRPVLTSPEEMEMV